MIKLINLTFELIHNNKINTNFIKINDFKYT